VLKPMMFTFSDAGAGMPTAPNQLTFAVTLSEPAAGPVSVGWRTAPGTATATDFTAATGTLSFAAGERTRTIAFNVTGDRTAEADEVMVLQLINASGATLLRASATGTIRNDDGPIIVAPRPPPPPTGPTGGLSGSIRVTQDWGTGYVAEVTLRNGGPALSTWQFALWTADTVVNLWDGMIKRQAGDAYRIGNAAWNGSLATRASVTLGFQAKGSDLPTQSDLFFGQGRIRSDGAAGGSA
jgi:chitinase